MRQSLYYESGENITIKFSGYEFRCRPNFIDASFSGRDLSAFSLWVNSRLEYPEKAKEEGIQGRVLTRFTIDDEGYVRNVEIVESAGPLLDKEAIRVISSSPRWTPAMRGKEPVAASYDFPVIFQLW